MYPDTFTIPLNEAQDFYYEGGNDEYEQVEIGDWVDEGKYTFGYLIVKRIDTDVFYRADISRSGSYHSDYYYSFEYSGLDFYRVEQKEIITKIWSKV